ncbi:hypothetical protein K2F43_15645 [Clostridium estertheticum]|uniref:hypothetical protein n=1 Tax=Clostridium estertheticum TaxID=238834 RepID=UPI001C6E24CA|nr:hypothetical protein [Clostridium estertheticum]MBW9172638.1 hypothetical protein [Clostridium estertheticum]WLC73618.1 hypothetical protein KTC99_12515 [Clostridium estertheticum]
MTTDNDKKYELKLDKTKQILFAKAFGSFGPSDADDFVRDYTIILKPVNAKEYELQFDCKELKVSGKDTKSGVDMTNMLKGCLEMYKKEGFKNIIFDCTKNIVLKMQLQRLCKEAGLSTATVK